MFGLCVSVCVCVQAGVCVYVNLVLLVRIIPGLGLMLGSFAECCSPHGKPPKVADCSAMSALICNNASSCVIAFISDFAGTSGTFGSSNFFKDFEVVITRVP